MLYYVTYVEHGSAFERKSAVVNMKAPHLDNRLITGTCVDVSLAGHSANCSVMSVLQERNPSLQYISKMMLRLDLSVFDMYVAPSGEETLRHF